jgi:large subunit ribosomal protein L25
VETIQATLRAAKTTQDLRRDGWIPAVVYGSNIGNTPIQVKAKELDHALRRQTTNKPFALSLEGKEYTVMVYELQRHPVSATLLHADFKQINMNERIHTSVPIVLSGDPELGVATLVRHSVEVTCLPTDIPESFTVNVDGLNIGDVILVKDLDVPDNVTVVLDELEVVVSVLPVKASTDEAAEAQKEAEGVAETAKAPVEEAKKV